ncbi:hypothetical protein NDN08_002818 [Rhodosorus marinus]|uniref:Serine/threonine-protein kinase TOR n=1 Tax=Rhodosorus marinus TaxID=101924 RepID=A0AAV8UUV3_9RHOD|nr:hypothetical protein NDN08_002818 [Rhodosorus marinus]
MVQVRDEGASKVETLLNELKYASGQSARRAAAKTLRETLEFELNQAGGTTGRVGGAGDTVMASSAAATNLMNKVSTLLQMNFLSSADMNERLAGIAALDELIDLQGETYEAKVQRSSNGFRVILGKVWDVETARQAAAALGHLSRLGGVLTNRCIEDELARALERLRDNSKGTGSVTRAAAVMVLHQLAESAPSQVNANRNELVRTIWNPATDVKPEVREEAIKALGAFLNVVSHREATDATQVVETLSKQIFEWLRSPTATNEQVHGSLLALGALLKNPFSSDYLHPHFDSLCGLTLSFKASRDKYIRTAVAGVIALLASEEPRVFAEKYLDSSFRFLAKLAQGEDSNSAFASIGILAAAVGGDAFEKYVDEAFVLIGKALSPGTSGHQQVGRSAAAIECVGTLARAIGSENEGFVRGVGKIMDRLFSGFLNPKLVASLNDVARNVPSLNGVIQERILDSAYSVLVKKKVQDTTQRSTIENGVRVRKHSMEPVVLALKAIPEFDFSGMDAKILTAFVVECVVPYMDSYDSVIRKESTIACSRLLACSAAGGSSVIRKDVAGLLSRLLATAVADMDKTIRIVALQGLDDRNFEVYLAQPSSLRELFLCFYDEKLEVREKAVKLAGNLCAKNPAQSLPALRKFLMRLMMTLRCGGDAQQVKQGHAAQLLSLLIQEAPRLVQPYVRPILEVLISRLAEAHMSSDIDAATPLLQAIGDFASGGKTELKEFLADLLPLIVASLQVQSAEPEFRKSALRALSRMVRNTGCVIDPYRRYPTLLSSLLSTLRFEVDPAVRLEVETLLGTMGAINPEDFSSTAIPSLVGFAEISTSDAGGSVKFIGNRGSLRGLFAGTPRSQYNVAAVQLSQGLAEKRVEARTRAMPLPVETSVALKKGYQTEQGFPWMEDVLASPSLVARLNHPFTANPEYFPSAALDALHRILANPRLAEHHNEAVNAVVLILLSLKSDCVKFLPVCLPRLLWLLRPDEKVYDLKFKRYVAKRLGMVVKEARQHMREYSADVLALVRCYWNKTELLQSMLLLVENLCIALGDLFRPLVPDLLPPMLGVFNSDKSENRSATFYVLQAIEKFGSQLDDHVVSVLPAMLAVAENYEVPNSVRLEALAVMSRLISCLPIADIASCLILPLSRIASSSLSQELTVAAQQVLVKVGRQMQHDFLIFAGTISKAIASSGVREASLEELLSDSPGSKSRSLGPRQPALIMATPQPEERAEENPPADRIYVHSRSLRRAWEVGRRVTRSDWDAWMQKLASALFRESGSPGIRSCARLAEAYPQLAHELFNPAFLSCWTKLTSATQAGLVGALETALSSETLPLDALQTLLGLAEFMEHDEKPLPIDLRRLAAMACRCGAYAKALHYKEAEYVQNPASAILGDDGLISIYDNLGQRESAVGVLIDAERRFGVRRREEWFEKLQRWDDALAAYDADGIVTVEDDGTRLSEWDRKMGRIRCLNELGEWRRMDDLCAQAWEESEGSDDMRQQLAMEGAASVALSLGRWDEFAERVAYIQPDVFQGSFYRALLSVHAANFEKAKELLDATRKMLDTGLTARVGEGYKRAYLEVLNAQLLVELEESIEFLMDPSQAGKRKLAAMWRSRLNGCRNDHRTWYRTLTVRGVVLTEQENMAEWLKFASLCIKAGRRPMASEALRALLPQSAVEAATGGTKGDIVLADRVELWDPEVVLKDADPRVQFAFLKHMWAADRKIEAYGLLLRKAKEKVPGEGEQASHLHAEFYLTLSRWARKIWENASAGNGTFPWEEIPVDDILEHAQRATELSPSWYKAWHNWALVNNELATVNYDGSTPSNVTSDVKKHVVSAINGFFQAITLGGETRGTQLQDVLRLLTLWFRYGGIPVVQTAFEKGFAVTEDDLWLDVVPQMIARLHTPVKDVRKGLKQLLVRIGQSHPQALIYALTVAAKSSNKVRRDVATEILSTMRLQFAALVEQAELVSRELIRVAILWHEMWHEGLEEASRVQFGDKNVEGMLKVLEPLHALMEAGPVTRREVEFDREYGRDLAEAWDWCRRYRRSKREAELNQAWELYYHVFRKIAKQLSQMTTLELGKVSPRLLHAKNLELAVPGTYKSKEGTGSEGLVTIQSFNPTLTVISSKQRPRKLVMYGSDGKEHAFLLKGHEDLRLDERVMQLLRLVNELLAQSKDTASRDLAIKRYAVVPLSPNSGLIGWVANCDTLHTLVRDFREQRKILLNVELRLILQMAPDYDNLPRLNKVEVFEYALANTTGADIARVLWLKSRNAEIWLDRRTNFIRSLATMSMVGYILGLGDRHPSNLMLERSTGKILHIDFGDCFEVAMHREKYPEKVPFRLTRMLVNALEVCGVEGFFRQTCEAVMTVLRNDKPSLMAMLEAFVHDPLINWRLLGDAEQGQRNSDDGNRSELVTGSVANAADDAIRGIKSKGFASSFTEMGGPGVASLSDVARQYNKMIEDDEQRQSARPRPSLAAQQPEGAAENAVPPSLSTTFRRGLQRQVGPEGVQTTEVEYQDAVNQRAVAAIQRVSNKLTGRDFDYSEVLAVPAQVDRLIRQATATEKLCCLYVGWCAFW